MPRYGDDGKHTPKPVTKTVISSSLDGIGVSVEPIVYLIL